MGRDWEDSWWALLESCLSKECRLKYVNWKGPLVLKIVKLSPRSDFLKATQQVSNRAKMRICIDRLPVQNALSTVPTKTGITVPYTCIECLLYYQKPCSVCYTY